MNTKTKILVGILAIGLILIILLSIQPLKNTTQTELKISVDGNFKVMHTIQLPIDVTEARTIVEKFCEPENPDNAYGYDTIKKVDDKWRIQIVNMNCLCYASVNTETGETNCTECICAGLFPPFGEEVTITTDKTEYGRGEMITVIVTNNREASISYSSFPFMLYKHKDRKWEAFVYPWRSGLMEPQVEVVPPFEEIEPPLVEMKTDTGKVFSDLIDTKRLVPGRYKIEFQYTIGPNKKIWETIHSNEFMIKEEQEVTITTDKTEYEQGETVKITVRNNFGGEICYLTYSGSDCWKLPFRVENFISDENKWEDIPIGKQIEGCPQYMSMPASKCSNEPINFSWDQHQMNKGVVSAGKYRISFPNFPYKKQKLIETKEIGKIICEGENIPDELKELLLNGKWIMGDVLNKGCAMCEACGCSCTMKNAWAIDGAVIDVTYVSCSGNSYTIKYKGEEYNCVSESYKNPLQRLPIPIPSEDWNIIYSNEFTIKEKFRCENLDPKYCERDIDCICEQRRGCFMGNKNYYESCINESIKSSLMCLDMCMQELCKCVDNKCDCGHDFA